MGMAFESFPVNRNLPDCCHLSKTVEGTLATTSASCFSTLRCFPSGIWDLCVSRWVKWYQTLFFFYTLLTFPFATDAHTPHFAFLVFSWWFQFQLTFGFPDSVPTRAGNTFVLLLPPDVPPAVLHLSSGHVHPRWPSAMLACLPARWKGPFVCSEETVLENQPALLHPFAPWGSFPLGCCQTGPRRG